MYIINKNQNKYQIKIPNHKINIFNKEDIKELTQKVVNKVNKKYKLNNLIILDIYYNNQYGTIMIIKNYKKLPLSPDKEVKITIHNDIPFLYKIDYFTILENNLLNQNIYYYKNNFYLEIKEEIPQYQYLNILENSEIIYEDTFDIINYGLKIKV